MVISVWVWACFIQIHWLQWVLQSSLQSVHMMTCMLLLLHKCPAVLYKVVSLHRNCLFNSSNITHSHSVSKPEVFKETASLLQRAGVEVMYVCILLSPTPTLRTGCTWYVWFSLVCVVLINFGREKYVFEEVLIW